MVDELRFAVSLPEDGAPPGIIAQRAWEAGRDADVVVLPALPTEPGGTVDKLNEAAERSALLREKLVRNLVGSTALVATAIVEFGAQGPGLVGMLVSAEGVEARGFQRHAPDWAETIGSQPAVHGGVAVLIGEDADAVGFRAAADAGASVVAVSGTIGQTRVVRLGGDWQVVPMTDEHAAQLVAWRHEPPLDFYDTDRFPEDAAQLLDAAFRDQHKATVVDGEGTMVGHAEWHEEEGAVTVGLGLRPDLIGRGYGEWLVRLVLEAVGQRFAPTRVELSVADWNSRAITVYERCGFVDTGRRTVRPDVTFVEMSAEA